MTIFIATNLVFLNPCYDGNLYTFATTKELKKKAFALNIQNVKQVIGIQVTFMLEIKSQKYTF